MASPEMKSIRFALCISPLDVPAAADEAALFAADTAIC